VRPLLSIYPRPWIRPTNGLQSVLGYLYKLKCVVHKWTIVAILVTIVNLQS
jgi:hypothetical protein